MIIIWSATIFGSSTFPIQWFTPIHDGPKVGLAMLLGKSMIMAASYIMVAVDQSWPTIARAQRHRGKGIRQWQPFVGHEGIAERRALFIGRPLACGCRAGGAAVDASVPPCTTRGKVLSLTLA